MAPRTFAQRADEEADVPRDHRNIRGSAIWRRQTSGSDVRALDQGMAADRLGAPHVEDQPARDHVQGIASQDHDLWRVAFVDPVEGEGGVDRLDDDVARPRSYHAR